MYAATGNSAAYYAAKYGQFGALHLLLHYGADVSVRCMYATLPPSCSNDNCLSGWKKRRRLCYIRAVLFRYFGMDFVKSIMPAYADEVLASGGEEVWRASLHAAPAGAHHP